MMTHGSETPQAGPDAQAPVICGIGLRVPGARTPDAMWRILTEGRCTVSTIRTDYFDPALYTDTKQTRRGKAYTFAVGQLDRINHFDPGFFGISPREAEQMDPQQKMMLQTVWEAVEDAGLNMADLAGERTGVFVGSSLVENLTHYYLDPARGGSSWILGNTLCVIANRVSSVFDFGGPSYVMDAACSSALYALHQAAVALRSGEIDTAIVGGVHVLQSPGGFVGFSQARMLSPTGLCRAFDASADGYVRSEASVAVVLQRPDTAARMQSRQRARLLATGVNTDGAASAITVPSAPRQERLIDRVLAASGRDPDDFAFYEAHGTGTQVGDPVEAASIGNAIGKQRIDPLLIGSAKTNFGHSEPAAGLVGLAKSLLAMQHRVMPASLHFKSPNPNIDFEDLNLRVNTAPTPLAQDGPLLSGLNSFGFGGTNVTAVIESVAPRTVKLHSVAPAPAPATTPWLLLTAASGPSLQQLAGLWADHLAATDTADWPALAAATARVRAPLTQRLAVPLDAGAPAVLRRFAPDTDNIGHVHGTATFARPRTVFAYAGNGAQYQGMGRAQYRDDPAYRASFDATAEAFASEGITGLADLLHSDTLADALLSPLVAQPLLFACQIAQTRSLQAAGLQAGATIGHSVGEIAALHVAGGFDLAAAARIVASRSRAFETLRGQGTMAAVAASEADVNTALRGLNDPSLVIAAVNSPRSVTLSGPQASFDRLRRVSVNGKRLAIVRLKIEVPYHSPLIDTLQGRFMADLAGIDFAPLQLPVAGAAVGRMLRPRDCDAAYLWRNARDTVRFADALAVLAKEGPAQIIEVSPKPVLNGNVRDLSRFSGLPVSHFPAALEGTPETTAQTAVRAWSCGIAVDTLRLAGRLEGPSPALPRYPWDDAPYKTALSADGFDGWAEIGARKTAGRRPDRDVGVWTAEFMPDFPAWVADHKVAGTPVIAAAVLADMALGAASELWAASPLELRDFDILAPAMVTDDGIRIRTEIDPQTGSLLMKQRPRLTQTTWSTLARGVIRRTAKPAPSRPVRAPAPDGDRVAETYAFLTARGLAYGDSFRRMAAVAAPDSKTTWVALTDAAPMAGSTLDPTALDGAFHGLAAAAQRWITGKPPKGSATLIDALRRNNTLLPVRIGELVLWQATSQPVGARLDLVKLRKRSVLVDIVLFDASGTVVAQIAGAEFAVARLDAGRQIAPLRTQITTARLRMAGQPVVLPRGWARPDAALSRLGLVPSAPDSPLRDAVGAFHRALADKPAARDAALARLLHLAPVLSDDIRVTMARKRGQPARDVAAHAALQMQGWEVARRLLDRLAKDWRKAERLNVLILGAGPAAGLRALASDPRIDRLAASDVTPDGISFLRQTLPPWLAPFIDAAPQAADYDLVIALGDAAPADRTPQALAAGGLFIRLDTPDMQPDTAPAPAATDVQRFDLGGVLPLRVTIRRAGHADAQQAAPAIPKLAVINSLPQPLPEGLRGITALAAGPQDVPTHRALIHHHRASDTVAEVLGAILLALKFEMMNGDGPLLVICVNEGGTGFDVLVAGLAGVMRTVANEDPDRKAALLAFKTLPDVQSPAAFAAVIAAAEGETCILHDENGLRAERIGLAPQIRPAAPVLRLGMTAPGKLETLGWAPAARARLSHDRIEIAVAATGLNFRDVMWARGLLPDRILDKGASGAGLGMECAGTVLRAGAKSGYKAGDRVMAFAPDAFSTSVTVPASAAVAVPAGMTLEAAAALPVVFVTAWEALVRLARLEKGDTVLIHGAAGGVGLAAVQIAKMLGATVYATAGTDEKRAIARAYGADAVFESRDLGFADAVRDATKGRGVDVVLNSLFGEAMQRSVECLAPFGRFVELGKRDYLEGTQLDLRPFAENLSYFGFDLDTRLAKDPSGVARSMQAVTDAFAAGDLQALPVTAFAADAAEDAFRHMLAARHAGKIVITAPRKGKTRTARGPRDAWVLIGGTGGVGLAIGQALLADGASHVHLVSRDGAVKPGSGKIAAWTRDNPRVSFHACDASDPAALAQVFAAVDAAGHRLGGVVNGAMVLRDRMLRDLDRVEAGTVITAKLGVTAALDKVLRSRAQMPDHIIYLSSIAAQLGNPGQASYTAANSAMEAFAAGQRAAGWPALAIGWGAVADQGYLTQNAAVATQLSALDGFGMLSVQMLVDELLAAIREGRAGNYCYAPVDWARLAPMLPALGTAAFTPLVPFGAGNVTTKGALATLLQELDWPAAQARVEAEMRDILSTILRMPPDQFDLYHPLVRYGIDSLMAMELRLEVEQRFGGALPVFAVNDEMTAARLAAGLLERIKGTEDPDIAEL